MFIVQVSLDGAWEQDVVTCVLDLTLHILE